MSPERWRQVEEVYHSALEWAADQRATFLDEACGDDHELRREVESLLGHGESQEALVDRPVWEAAGELLDIHTLDRVPNLVGQRISHYQIIEKLGEGGMGMVYKARDTRLGRSVALKFLKAQFSGRFEREARAIAALNHPHIAALHDVGEHEGVPYLAMEFVEGRPLKGPRPVKEVIEYGIQIADALAAAHAAGIVHRDLKPGNLLLTGKGSVKVLDFGLAKLRAQVGDGAPATATLTGISAGTPGYMSPEQIDGKPADARSDIFSFGCVLYELASGRHAFGGNSVGSVLAATATQEPRPLDGVPEKLSEVIRRCLRKDPARRFQHMDDVKITLEELKEESDSGQLTGISAAERKRPRRWLWAIAAGAVLLLAVGLALRLREASSPADISPVALTAYPGIEGQPSFSPDGSKVAFAWNGEKEDNYDICVKHIGSAGPPMRLTTSPSAEAYPAWSPDDRWIAFMRQQQDGVAVTLISPLGGPERALTETASPVGLSWTPGATWMAGLSWTPDAKWLAVAALDSPKQTSSIWAISVETRERRRLTAVLMKSEVVSRPLGDSFPSFSPDGRALAFGREVKDYVVELYVQRLTRDLRPAGEPARVTDQQYPSVAGIAWTADGRDIVYGAGGDRIENLRRVRISGQRPSKRLPYALPAATQPAIARVPPRLAYTWGIRNENLWRLDTHTGERKMLTGSTYLRRWPQYSPDGRKLAFQSDETGNWEVWTCDAEGSNCLQLTSFGGSVCGTPRWSPDSRWLTLDSRAAGQPEVYVIAADGGTPRRLTDHPANDLVPSWSRDGGWIYFASDRSGRYEVWKVPTDGGEAVQVTRAGGFCAFESSDGKYVYYSKLSQQGLFRSPAQGGEETQVLQRLSGNRHFAVTAKGVYFMLDRRTIEFLDTATGKVRTLASLDKPVGSGLCVSSDDAYVVWSQLDRVNTDLMLVENFR